MGQFFSDGDFHSDLERQAFKQLSSSKPIDPLIFFVTANHENDFKDYQDLILSVKNIPDELQSERFNKFDDEKKANYVFNKTQNKYFKRFSLYNAFDELLDNGVYNCISGTAFYAILYHEMGLDLKIYETPYHAFLELQDLNGKNILVESTDASFGFVDKHQKIVERKEAYSFNGDLFQIQGIGNQNDQQEISYLAEISLLQLAGLQYYNLAVVEFNDGNFDKSSKLLKKASYLYPSSRIITLQMLSEKYLASSN